VRPNLRHVRTWLALVALVVAALAAGAPLRAECVPRDVLSMPLPSDRRDPIAVALALAYPGLTVTGGQVRFPDGRSLPLGTDRGLAPRERLASAQIAEQFVDVYPLDFDLQSRLVPWFDPGRARNDAFFRALWFDSESAARATLVTVAYPAARGPVRFSVTSRHCVAVQLAAALVEIAALGPDMDRYFANVGGSFNWRRISGTNRLSAHSFGIAVDFDTQLGGYWQWSRQPEGAVGAYANRYPEALVRAMERRGFIWGGKWHHYDGMHFEYRPELILYARIVGRGRL